MCSSSVHISTTSIPFIIVFFSWFVHDIRLAYPGEELNGIYEHTSGLPDMYGMDLTVLWEGGESLAAYDNSENWMSLAVMEELDALFLAQKPQ